MLAYESVFSRDSWMAESRNILTITLGIHIFKIIYMISFTSSTSTLLSVSVKLMKLSIYMETHVL